MTRDYHCRGTSRFHCVDYSCQRPYTWDLQSRGCHDVGITCTGLLVAGYHSSNHLISGGGLFTYLIRYVTNLHSVTDQQRPIAILSLHTLSNEPSSP